jgi:hypothetical protein
MMEDLLKLIKKWQPTYLDLTAPAGKRGKFTKGTRDD